MKGQGRQAAKRRITHIFGSGLGKAYKLQTWYTDPVRWAGSPTCAVTSKYTGQRRNVTSSLWRVFAHNSTKRSHWSTKIGRKVCPCHGWHCKVLKSKVNVTRPLWVAVQVISQGILWRPNYRPHSLLLINPLMHDLFSRQNVVSSVAKDLWWVSETYFIWIWKGVFHSKILRRSMCTNGLTSFAVESFLFMYVAYCILTYRITNMGMIFLTLLLSYCNDSTITSISCTVRVIRSRNKNYTKILKKVVLKAM